MATPLVRKYILEGEFDKFKGAWEIAKPEARASTST